MYDAYHHIDYIKPLNLSNQLDDQAGKRQLFDIVGPVCESGDFLGKDRYLLQQVSNDSEKEFTQEEPIYLAVMDVGAYCSAMSLNYNLHQKPCEIIIEEKIDNDNNNSCYKFFLSRQPDSLVDIFKPFTFT